MRRLTEARIRPATPQDLDAIYAMGFDAWGGGQGLEAYLAGCRRSPKYARGTWYVLGEESGRPVSSLITYALPVWRGEPTVGLGSIATAPERRGQGWASRLIRDILGMLRTEGSVFYLHADVSPSFYARLGFIALDPRYQRKPGTTTMIHGRPETVAERLAAPGFEPPAYF